MQDGLWLRQDMRWWFEASNHDVKIVLVNLSYPDNNNTLQVMKPVQVPTHHMLHEFLIRQALLASS